jgi:hypothetical protein
METNNLDTERLAGSRIPSAFTASIEYREHRRVM